MRKSDLSDVGTRKGVAELSSYENYTTFSYGGITLTFRTCNNLERYTKVLL
jgi:hypothetical protein